MAEEIETYQGIPVTAVRVIVRNLGDGLTKTAKARGRILDVDAMDTAFLAVKVRKTGEDYEFAEDSETGDVTATRIQEFKAITVSFTDEETVGASIRETQLAITRAEAAAKGQGELEFSSVSILVVDDRVRHLDSGLEGTLTEIDEGEDDEDMTHVVTLADGEVRRFRASDLERVEDDDEPADAKDLPVNAAQRAAMEGLDGQVDDAMSNA